MNSTQNGYAHQQQDMGPPPPPLQQSVSYSSQTNHQLPQTPQSQRPAARPTSKSGFSFRSHKSGGSADGVPKMDLHESPAEKRARRLSTKADPRMAMSEAEPSQLANDHSSSLQPLRLMQHKDMNGNLISDPDRSNPTRHRWERPLETIKAFEAAIEGNHTRKSGSRPDADSRRTSYAGSHVAPMKSYQGNGYNGYNSGRQGGGSQMGSQVGGYEGYDYNGIGRGGYPSRPDSYYSNNDNNNGYYPNRQRFPRQGSEPMLNNGYGNVGNGYRNEGSPARAVGYGRNAEQLSYETVTTGSGSSSDRMQYSTDPSSENSSFGFDERQEYGQDYNNYGAGAQQQQQQQQQQYDNGNGYPQGVQQKQYGGGSSPVGAYGGNNGYPEQARPAPPLKVDSGSRAPMRLGKSPPSAQQQQQPQSYDAYGAPTVGKGEKKKSWLGRKFSKRG